MKTIYPDVKRDSDGKFTESKLVLVERNEFIGRKTSAPEKPRIEIRERTRKNYITF